MYSRSNQRLVLREDEPITTLEIQQASASFGPATLKVMGLAFDQAWAEIAPNFDSDSQQSQLIRLVLAKAILRVATDESRNVEALKNEIEELCAQETVKSMEIERP